MTADEPATCAEPACDEPAVLSTDRCRAHLVEELRAAGETIPFEGRPELEGLFAVVVHHARGALAVIPEAAVASPERTRLDVVASIERQEDWQFAHAALDVLGTYLSDRFGSMTLDAPEGAGSSVLLHLRSVVPAATPETFKRLLESAMMDIVDELVRPASQDWGGVIVHLGIGTERGRQAGPRDEEGMG